MFLFDDLLSVAKRARTSTCTFMCWPYEEESGAYTFIVKMGGELNFVVPRKTEGIKGLSLCEDDSNFGPKEERKSSIAL